MTKSTKVALTSLMAVAVAVAALATSFSPAVAAFSLRATQVPFCTGSLQTYLTANDGGVTVTTDQLDAQTFASSVSGNATFTLQIELAGNAASNNIGVYNGADASPALRQVFPGAATAGWFATCHFTSTGNLTVLLYDNSDPPVFQTSTSYSGVTRNNFGFYLQGPGGTFYSQDARNGGNPQVLTYAGTNFNYGDWWECFEDLPYSGAGCLGPSDFEDAVLLLQSVVPTPVHGKTWGALKTLYR